MALPLHRTSGRVVFDNIDENPDVRIELNGEVVVGTEVRWVGNDGNPCAIGADDAHKQQRFSITTDWEDVEE